MLVNRYYFIKQVAQEKPAVYFCSMIIYYQPLKFNYYENKRIQIRNRRSKEIFI
jgi:hypothetical protein